MFYLDKYPSLVSGILWSTHEAALSVHTASHEVFYIEVHACTSTLQRRDVIQNYRMFQRRCALRGRRIYGIAEEKAR